MRLKFYLKKAQREKWALGQFNFSTFEQLKAILLAAKKLHSPVILGTSEGESNFLGLEEVVNFVKFYQGKFKIPIFLNLDHGKSFSYIKKAIDAGYDAVHFDGSKLSFSENIKKTKEILKYAQKFNVLVEGEVGIISTETSKLYKETFKIKEKDLTDSDDAKKFVEKTNVDSLAVSIGTFHGISLKGKNPKIKLKRLKEIKKKLGTTPLVLHGGSGTSKEDIKKAIKLGIVKININTEIRVAYTNTLKKTFKEKPEETTPYKYIPEAIKAVQKVVGEKIKLFGSASKT